MGIARRTLFTRDTLHETTGKMIGETLAFFSQEPSMEATPKTPLLTTGPWEETAVISADILANLQVNNLEFF